MYKIVFGNKFLKSAEKLDKQLKFRLQASLNVLSSNPFHSILHTKSLSGKLAGFYSFRLGRDFRIIFQFLPNDTIRLLRAGHRKDIYL